MSIGISARTRDQAVRIEGNDGYRLYLNGRLVIDNWRKQAFVDAPPTFASRLAARTRSGSSTSRAPATRGSS